MKRMVRFQTISYKPGTNCLGQTPISYIRIVNKMLEKFGFKYGDKIVVIYENEKLTILTSKEYKKQYGQDNF